MGIFDFFKKGGSQSGSKPSTSSYQQQTQQVQPTSPSKPTSSYDNGLKMRKEEAVEQLNLRKETLALTMRKKNMNNVFARVAVAMDDSGSMESLYEKGTVQSVLERLLPVALKFDDNGELDMWLFANKFKRLPSITEEDFFDYVNREVMHRASWGGTNYSPVINDIVRKYAKEEPSDIPTFVLFITDGENFDRNEAERAIREASRYNIFFQFIGLGNEDFRFLKELDEMEGRFIDNANFFEIRSINRISDDQLYDLLLTEYPIWEKEAKRVGLLR
ncbi:stress protein [Bacillus sp. M6-12]|uniref:vWA domain-containing protein n=1 Tax=Bacillus sp. M6-12 TaxID=2054166 RepID=UPI000C79139F|nr:VWA domain-containing protein [Bacillus sp. M6-12]PLS19571.1 stress protein [Bacillus sp. M6-12]